VYLGGAVGTWGLVVTVLLAMLGLPSQPAVLGLLAGGILAVAVAVHLIRHEPAAGQAIVARPASTAPRRRARPPVAEESDRLAG
jgi:hypothetical protein